MHSELFLPLSLLQGERNHANVSECEHILICSIVVVDENEVYKAIQAIKKDIVVKPVQKKEQPVAFPSCFQHNHLLLQSLSNSIQKERNQMKLHSYELKEAVVERDIASIVVDASHLLL